MSDTATQPTLSDNLETVVKAAPILAQSPGLAVGVASSGGDTQLRAQSVARGVQAISDGNAAQRVDTSTNGGLGGALNWFGNAVSHVVGGVTHDVAQGAKTAVSDVAGALNKPLSIVQHEYRYLHDVEASHGMLAAVSEGIGIAAGAGLGFVGGGVYGAALGGELAAGAESQMFYRDSWQRTGSASYVDPHTHQPVSLGRDLVSFLADHGVAPRQGTIPFKITSGLIDGIFDMSLGGNEALGMLGEARSAAGAAGKLGQYFTGTAPQTAEDLMNVYNRYGSVRRAFADIARKSAGEIVATPAYQTLRDPDLLRALGNAQTGEDVAHVFASALETHALAFTDKLPTLTRTRQFGQTLREYAENAGGVPGAVARGLTRMPEAYNTVDGGVREISAHEFDPSDPIDNGAVGYYRMLRYTEDRRTAASLVNQYINEPDLQRRVAMFRNESLNMLFQQAGFQGTRDEYLAQFANPVHQQAMARVLDDIVGGGAFGKEAIYGLDRGGRILGLLRDSQGQWQYGAAITDNQTGKLRYLDLSEARRAAKMLAGAQSIFDADGKGVIGRTLAGGDYVGRLDDFAYHHITQGIFKPLVLLTPSYALHISLAELIPNTLRLGVRNMVKNGIAINVAKLADKANYEDLYKSKMDEAVSGLAYRMLDHLTGGRIGELATNPDAIANSEMGRRLQLAARYIEYNDGYAPSALLTGHYSPTEIGQREEVSARLMRHGIGSSGQRLGDTFRRFGPDEAGHTDAWQAWLREIGNDKASQIGAHEVLRGLREGKTVDEAAGEASGLVAHWLRNQPEEYLRRYLRSDERFTSLPANMDRPPGMDQFDEWAKVKVENMLGATWNPAAQAVHPDLLGNIANGEWADRHTLANIDREAKPTAKGQEIVPDGESKVQRIANAGFRRVLNPMVNFISRQPIAFTQFEQEWAKVEPLIDAGRLGEDEGMTLAMNRTVNNVIKQVHNIHDRTQWTITARNWMPFYFAQEQAYRRFGRLLAENPAAFRKYALMIANVHDIGQVFQGPNGRGYFVLPGTGWMTSGVVGALAHMGAPVEGSSPVGMGWNLSGMNVIFPLSAGVRPDLGPLVAVPLQTAADLFPEMGAPTLKADVTAGENAILGGAAASQSVWNQVIPNVIAQRVLTAIDPNLNERSFNSTMMQTLLTLDYEHKIPAADAGYMKWQQFIDRVKNQTRVMYLMKGLVGAVTPVSPEITDPIYNKFSGELAADIQKTGSVIKGTQEFITKNPEATPFTVWESSSPTGVTPPDSVGAENWINNNSAFIAAHPYSAFYFMPQLTDNAYNATVYNEQIAQGYRVKYNPEANPVGNLGSSFLAQIYIAAGNSFIYDNPQNYPLYKQQMQTLTGTQKYQAELNWQNFIATYSKQNPVWGQYYAEDPKQSNRGQAIQEIQDVIAKHEIPDPNSEQSKGIIGLMNDYAVYQNQLNVGRQDAFATQSQSSINQQWDDYLVSVATDHPELRAVINGLFLSLPANLGVTNG